MDTPRAEKVAVVDEVRARLEGASATVVTEYRGLTVAELAQLRSALAEAGGEYKVFKNTLVRRAVADSPHQGLEPMLTGPTAIAFVHQDVSAVAKTLREFARNSPSLVIKGGLLDGAPLSAADLTALAELPSREVLLAQLAGAMAAPLSQLAGLLQALPRNLAYGLSALVDQRGGAPEAGAEAVTADESAPEAAAEAATAEESAAEAAVAEEAAPTGEAATEESGAADEAAPEAAG